MKITMVKTVTDTADGKLIRSFVDGITYDVSDDFGTRQVTKGNARMADDEPMKLKRRPANKKQQAPANKGAKHGN